MLKYTQITWSWTVKSILLMACVCIQSRTHFAFNFVVSRRFYICFQARWKVLIHSTSHYSSCLKLSVSSAEQITLSEALYCRSSLSQLLLISLSVCLPMHADVCSDEARAAMTYFYLESLRFDFIWQNLFFFFPLSLPLSLSPSVCLQSLERKQQCPLTCSPDINLA